MTTLNAKLECVYLSTNICDADVKIVVGLLELYSAGIDLPISDRRLKKNFSTKC